MREDGIIVVLLSLLYSAIAVFVFEHLRKPAEEAGNSHERAEAKKAAYREEIKSLEESKEVWVWPT